MAPAPAFCAPAAYPTRRTMPTLVHLVEALDSNDEAYINETTCRRAASIDVAIDFLEGQYGGALLRVIAVNVSEGTSEDVTDAVLEETVRLAQTTGSHIPENVCDLLDDLRIPFPVSLRADLAMEAA